MPIDKCVPPSSNLVKLPHEVTVKCKGKKGHIASPSFTPFCYFRVTEFKAMDSLGGKATKVGQFFVGNLLQWWQKNVQDDASLWTSRFVSAEASMSSLGIERFDTTGHPLISIAFTVEFLEDCEFFITLSGEALKVPGESMREMRERVIVKYERESLMDWPADRREAVVKSLREAYAGEE